LEIAVSQWEMIKKACKTKTNKLAALLNDAHPVAVTNTDGCEVFIQVEFDFHYKRLLEPESRGVVEWALREILQVPCSCRFLQKDEPIPVSVTVAPALPSIQSDKGRAAGPQEPGAASEADRQAESVQPAAPTRLSDAPANGAAPAGRSSDALPSQNGYGVSAAPPRRASPAQASAPPANPLEAKVRQDPVVEEIIKTYGAKLVEWESLGE
jgi:hypothetical protein